MDSKKVAIVGTGPAALMAGTILVENGWDVDYYDQKKAAARKFLVAGHGGFNLTNDQDISSFIENYDHPFIQKAVKKYSKDDFIKFLNKIGIETFVGTSGKIFPIKGIKPIDVLNSWLEYLKAQGTKFYFNHKWIDFKDGFLKFEKGDNKIEKEYDKFIFSLGGSSWGKTGSDGTWLEIFNEKGILCNDFQSSNSAVEIKNIGLFHEFEGDVIKNINLFSSETEKKGDILITSFGFEGAPVYALNKSFRKGIPVYLDLKPTFTLEEIRSKLDSSKNVIEGLKKLKIPKAFVSFFKTNLNKSDFINPLILAQLIKKHEIIFKSFRPIDEVISTIGGVAMQEVNETFELKNFKEIYCIGEMLDWDAPTGGYLIQGCVSSGFVAGQSIVDQS